MAEGGAVARTDGYPDDFPTSIPVYPGATDVVAKKTLGLRLAPVWDVSFSTTDSPGQVALFYLQNMHGYQGSGTTSPSGKAENHWENATYHMDMYATPVVTTADAAAGFARRAERHLHEVTPPGAITLRGPCVIPALRKGERPRGKAAPPARPRLKSAPELEYCGSVPFLCDSWGRLFEPAQARDRADPFQPTSGGKS